MYDSSQVAFCAVRAILFETCILYVGKYFNPGKKEKVMTSIQIIIFSIYLFYTYIIFIHILYHQEYLIRDTSIVKK